VKEKKVTLKKNKKIAIVYRIHSPDAVKMAKKVVDFLKNKKYFLYTAPEQKAIAGTASIVSSNELKEMSLIIVLGGDGTYLRAVRLLRGHPVPILGFNMGSLGFLTSHPVDNIFDIINQTLKNEMVTQSRSRLQTTVKNKAGKKLVFEALNDIVIERGSYSQLISTSVIFDGAFVNDIKADGLIISTPTGSTAYNLAAGGPILYPEARALVVTPVAPHSLTSRPLIFPDHQKLILKLQAQTSSAHLIIDGQKVMELSPEDEVVIVRCLKDHLMIRMPHHNFFNLLKEKLNFGDRDATRT
jgi:NAD+ kinase